uniref:Chaperone DnaJ-domain superfamily protein n=1 Tax=Monsonia marlothii TaxID=163685 RepID=A0A0F7CZC5_9ROSI
MAAVTTTSAAVSLSPKSFPSPPPPKINATATFSSSSFSFATKPSRRFISVIRNSSDVPAESTAAVTDSEIEVPEGPPSLISAFNVERALRGIPITDIDYYGLLGLPRSCRSEQVIAGAYKTKVDDVLSQELGEEEVNKKLELLKEAYRVLSSAQERRLYDWSLSRSENPDRYIWPFEVDDTRTSIGDPPPEEPEDVGPTRLVGYFFLGWLVLSFVMSIALNVNQ